MACLGQYAFLVIALLDYGAGNLRSVEKALLHIGAEVRVFQKPDGLEEAKGFVLPGVGAFDDCMCALQRQELFGAAKNLIQNGRPFLGICVGYQALFDRSEEFNSCAQGLSVFPGRVIRFSGKDGLKVPQIGWNELEIARPDCPILAGLPERPYVYFVHSFYPKPDDEGIVAAWTDYGERFASVVWRDRVFATQFHPEKSQENGLTILRNFVGFAEREG